MTDIAATRCIQKKNRQRPRRCYRRLCRPVLFFEASRPPAGNGLRLAWTARFSTSKRHLVRSEGTLPDSTKRTVGVRQGWGGTEAPRGALMHQVTINNYKITKYQCIVPTTWNASPKDTGANPGPIEASIIGSPYATTTTTFAGQAGSVTAAGGVEAMRCAQSFDPCIACAVH